MKNIRDIDNELYGTIYGLPRKGDFDTVWSDIKNDSELLLEAISVKKDKFGERDIVKGLAICDCMLVYHKNINADIYQKLVDLIYSNTDIARTVVNGYSNGGYSFLLMTLWNNDLVLTEEQKEFAISEAMNKIGTKLWKKRRDDFSTELDKQGISNSDTIIVDGQPIGTKDGIEHMNYVFSSLSNTQAHGIGEYDIRYYILRNSNWTIQEKKKLVYDFYCDSEEYDECLEQWEWGIVNDPANYNGDRFPHFDMIELYNYTYDQLLNFYCNRKTADKIWFEIEFCRLMHDLRPTMWEMEQSSVKRIGSI